MTQDKKLKKQIRARAAKTGESYATARRHTLAERTRRSAKPLAKEARRKSEQAGATGAVSNAKCKEKTGHGLEHWYSLLDAFDAGKKGHTAAARFLRDDHGVSAWYSQGITVAYERSRGLRSINQTTRGFEVSVSRVLPSSFERALAAISRKPERGRWLRDIGDDADELTVGGLANGKRRFEKRGDDNEERARLRWSRDDAHFELSIEGLEDGRSKAIIRATRMTKFEQVDRERQRWRSILGALRDHLAETA